ncbi:unnamed protein product, partial [Didymodactylos carnosus]
MGYQVTYGRGPKPGVERPDASPKVLSPPRLDKIPGVIRTAEGTRSRTRNKSELFSGDPVVNSSVKDRQQSDFDNNLSPSSPTTPLSDKTTFTMTDQALMACYKESLINMEKFSGDGTRTIDQFFSNIERIGSIVNAHEYVLYCMATSKLDAEAAGWYENNSTVVTTWSMLKAAMTERFKPLESASKAFQKLIERKQQPDESVTNYYDSIVKLCSKYDPKLPTKMIVSCLENGIKTELKTQIKRQMKLIPEDEWTPQIFLKVARNEDELQQDEQQKFQATHPYFILTQPHLSHQDPSP